MMTARTCPLCLWSPGPAAGPRRVAKLFIRCPNCGLFFQGETPGLEDLLSLYPADYEPHRSLHAECLSRQQRWALRRLAEKRARLVEQVRPTGGDLLDVGCGGGGFLEVLNARPIWHGVGLDVSVRAVQAARQQGIQALVSAAERPGLAPASFGVVTMWEVIEHVPDPRRVLRQIWRLLRPGGLLILSTPNCESWQARLWGPHWQGWDLPRHLQLFPPAALRKSIRQAGFRVIGRAALPTERFHAVASASRWLEAQDPRKTKVWTLAFDLFSWTVYPLFRLLEQTPYASTVVLIARKEV